MRVQRMADRWDAQQVPLYLTALVVGALVGVAFPADSGFVAALGALVNPALALLLFATFLGVPVVELAASWRDVRFLVAVLVVNFVVGSLVAIGLVVGVLPRATEPDAGIAFGALLVLLAPCVDYVVVFTGLAGGAAAKLLAATPVLLIGQALLVAPVMSRAGLPMPAFDDGPAGSMLGPLVTAFVVVIVVPFASAVGIQALAGRARWAQGVERRAAQLMVPIMVLVLLLVTVAHAGGVVARAGDVAPLLPLYAVFVIVMVVLGLLVGRVARLATAERRAVVMSGATRNSLVVLPIALALPRGFELAPVAVVTQTLVELVAMVVLVRVLPRIAR